MNQLLEELAESCKPRWMRVTGNFNVRGGISSIVVVETAANPAS